MAASGGGGARLACAGLEAVLFDLDGTITDTEPLWCAAEHRLVRSLGGRWSDDQAAALTGGSLLDTGSAILRAVGRDDLEPSWVVDQLLDSLVEELTSGPVPWRPGAVELLDSLGQAGVPCALVSASYRRLMDATISRLPAGTFATSVAGDEVVNGKPDPEPYRTACTRLGVEIRQCVVIEDSANGAAAGNAAGAVVVAVPSVAEIPHAPDRVHVDSLSGVDPEWLAELVGTGVLASGRPE